MSSQMAIALSVGVAATLEDLARRRISNWIPVAALSSGLWLHSHDRGWPGLGSSLLGALCGLAVFLAFYLLGGMGGGDVKLMAGFGAILGSAGMLLRAAIWVAAAGGVLALTLISLRAARGYWRARRPGAGAKQKGSDEAIPYAPAITVGVWLSLLAT